jgi:hypothetical protein
MNEKTCEECFVVSGAEHFERCCFVLRTELENVLRDAADDGEIDGGKPLSAARRIFAEEHVEAPVLIVFNPPVIACQCGETLSIRNEREGIEACLELERGPGVGVTLSGGLTLSGCGA